MTRVKGLSKEKKKERLMDTGKSLVIATGKDGWGKVEEVKVEINGNERRLDLGW